MLTTDSLVEAQDPDLVIDTARLHLAAVREPAVRVYRLLDAAHNETAHVAAAEGVVKPSGWLSPNVASSIHRLRTTRRGRCRATDLDRACLADGATSDGTTNGRAQHPAQKDAARSSGHKMLTSPSRAPSRVSIALGCHPACPGSRPNAAGRPRLRTGVGLGHKGPPVGGCERALSFAHGPNRTRGARDGSSRRAWTSPDGASTRYRTSG